MTKIHEYVNTATTDPIKALDYIDMDNEDGGGGYDVSKKVLVSEFQDFIQDSLGPLFTGDTTLVVAIGTAGTGAKGRWDRPYSTVTLALVDASSGDTIVVLGNPNELVTLKNGVDIDVHGNWIYTGSTANGYILDNSSGGVACNITISGDLINNNTNAAGGGCIHVSGTGSKVVISAGEVKQATTNGLQPAIIMFGNGSYSLVLNARLNGGVNIQPAGNNGHFTLNGDAVRDSGTDVHSLQMSGAGDSNKFTFNGNITNDLDIETLEVTSDCHAIINGNISTTIFTGISITVNSSVISIYGDAHSELGKTIFLDGNITGFFDGNFSSNSQTAADSVIRIESNTSGAIEIKGNVTLTNANSSAGALVGIASTAPVNVYANVTSDIAKVVSVTQTSTGFKLHGKITALGNTAASHPVNLENNGVNTMTLASSCVLVATHASAFGVSNDGNAVNQSVTNYGAVTNRMVDSDLAAAKVKALIHDSNVI